MVVLDVLDLPMIRRWHIVHLQGKPLSPAAEALRYFVLEHGAALIEAQFGNGAQGQPSTRPRGEEEVAAPAGVDSAPPAARQAGAPVGARPRKRAAR
jgi:hypothetical protein